jgi:diketogulonate reductase-like aldo/keto reductase
VRVCEDFCLCKEAINKIIISDARKKKVLKEYKHALKELELEMLDVYECRNLTVNDN